MTGTADVLRGLGFGASGPAFRLRADGRDLTPDSMAPVEAGRWRDGDVEVRLVPGRLGRAYTVTLEAEGVHHVEEVCLLDVELAPAPSEVVNHRWWAGNGWPRSTVMFARYGGAGFFAAYANPFGILAAEGRRQRLTYRPAMDVAGRFRSDPLVLGRFEPTGRTIRRELLPGRDIAVGREPGYAARLGSLPAELDTGEIAAVRDAVAAHAPWRPARARVAHWDWGQNLFRRHLLSDDGAVEAYERALQLAAEIGVEVALVAPSLRDDPWTLGGPWQRIMFLAQGLEVARGTWTAGPAPEPVGDVLAAARDVGLGIAAYSNPQALATDRDDWWVQPPGAQLPAEEGHRWLCLGIPEARDHVIATMTRFAAERDLRGYSLDFVLWTDCEATDHGHAPGTDSQYAQWHGYRTLLARLAESDDAWVETLIGSQLPLPWGVRDMTHPHPVLGDNQPQWVPAWPDLSIDRVNANWQRRNAYWMRNLAFLPSYKIPGQVGHQANRQHAWPVERGWDWEGARYNLLSAIATGPSSLSVCFLPCWDPQEWEGMRERDASFFRRWIEFARDNADVLSRLEDLFDEPAPGRVDGTIARDGRGGGFVFLTNPDHTHGSAAVPLDDGCILRELHPEPGRLWLPGTVTVDPHEVAVLEIVDRAALPRPALLGAAGSLDGDGAVVEAIGTPGLTVDAAILGTADDLQPLRLAFDSDGIAPELTGWRERDGRPVDLRDLAGDVEVRTTWVPGNRLPALLAGQAPPVRPEGDEHLRPWSDPSRLRLFPVILDPEQVTVRLWVDDTEQEVRPAYVGTFADVRDPTLAPLENNLLGYYVDVTEQLEDAVDLERPWRIRMAVTSLPTGHLSGVHVAHLPRRRTDGFRTLPRS